MLVACYMHARSIIPHPPSITTHKHINDDDIMHVSKIAISHMSACKYFCVSQNTVICLTLVL